jgi:hypothetical protein
MESNLRKKGEKNHGKLLLKYKYIYDLKKEGENQKPKNGETLSSSFFFY